MNLRRDIFQAIADPTRRSILVLLAAQSMSAGAIAERFDTARPTISKHIKVLADCELIEANPAGREIYYRIKMDKMKEIDLWLEQIRNAWEQRFDNLDKYLEKIQNNKK